MRKLSLFGCAVTIVAFGFSTTESLGDGMPRPKKGTCDLSKIIRPPISAKVDLQPGISADVLILRTATMQKAGSPDSPHIDFTEVGTVAIESDALGRIMNNSVNAMRARAGETCQFSISTFTGSATWGTPPSFRVYADGKGRKCTSFDYPCGPPEVSCEWRWDYQKCTTWMKMCTARQVFDLGNWDMTVDGTLPITADPSSNRININAARGEPVVNTGGVGAIADILKAIGLLKVFQDIDTSLRIDPSLDIIPSFGKLIAVNAPQDVTGSPRLVSANWVPVGDTKNGQFSTAGIGYVQTFSLKEPSGCLAARCLRKSSSNQDYVDCFLSGDNF
jgi:hypothetical protein